MDKATQFWDWFKINETKYYSLDQISDEIERDSILDELLEHLHRYCSNLYFELGGASNEKKDLIITAEGDVDYFDEVELLVAEAPDFELWNIIAFMQAGPVGVIKYEGVELDPHTSYFNPLENKNSQKLGLRIHVEQYDSGFKDQFLNAAYILVGHLLGEKSGALDIGYIDVTSFDSGLDKNKLIEFKKLPDYLNWLKSRSKV